MPLDKLDKQILLELDLDSRQTNKAIAKKLKASEQVVSYRINRMTETGIIEYFYALVNGARLGLLSFRIYLRLHSTNPKIEAELISSIIKNNFTTWIVSVRGKYDLVVSTYARSIEHFSELYDSLIKDFDKFILNKNICIVEEVQAFGRAHLIEQKGEKEIKMVYGGTPKKINVDSTDVKLLSKLSKMGRVSVTELSKDTGINCETIRYRLKKLSSAGIILGFRALPNLKKEGFLKYIVSLYLFSTSQKKLGKLAGFCAEHPNVLYFVKCIGDHEVDLEIEVEEESDFDLLLNVLKTNFHDLIRDYEILSISKEHKFNYFDLDKL